MIVAPGEGDPLAATPPRLLANDALLAALPTFALVKPAAAAAAATAGRSITAGGRAVLLLAALLPAVPAAVAGVAALSPVEVAVRRELGDSSSDVRREEACRAEGSALLYPPL
jgi:hypothetical protein